MGLHIVNIAQNLAISLGAFALVLAPASSIAINICNYVASHTTKVSRIPRLDLIDGIQGLFSFVVISPAYKRGAGKAHGKPTGVTILPTSMKIYTLGYLATLPTATLKQSRRNLKF